MVSSCRSGKQYGPCLEQPINLLAAFALLTFVVFLKVRGTAFGFALWPAILMIIMPMIALVWMAFTNGLNSLIGGTSVAMIILGCYLTLVSWKAVRSDH